ncbi:hypothetical protein B0I35DRAFT_411469 [Stachybotrys elegans]|uniref:PRISE-like Rossmann-fold domain-containing protein n=1 Tax=Stachybotrys elegans TaxID=80388 RepID=A0A8K0WNW6_9HYPO|nr:hypothetical protein B0I35DRAFT_411469 [Stachybotrys elegans]
MAPSHLVEGSYLRQLPLASHKRAAYSITMTTVWYKHVHADFCSKPCILGQELIAQLGKSSKWTIYALSHSKKPELPSNAQHISLDLLGSPSDMASSLQGIKTAEYVFFSAYLQKPSEQESWDINGDMLQNFLDALHTAGIASTVKRIVLVTGAKQYGVHLGPVKNPMQESDPWLRENQFPPNFYYRQQDILKKFCDERNKEGNKISWTVTYPNDVIGHAHGNFMNLAGALGIYVTISKELNQELTFPGSERFYTGFDSFTSASLHADFCEWAVFQDKAANQAFNVINGDVESWQNLWPKVAKHFGMKVNQNQFKQNNGSLSSSVELNPTAPLSIYAKEAGFEPPPGRLESNIDLTKWSQQDNVKKAWNKIVKRDGVREDGLEKATWSFLSFVLGRNYDLVMSMSKARELGWTGYEDTWVGLEKALNRLEEDKIIPKQK